MADLNDLGLSEKPQTDVDYDHMPMGVGGSIILPPQPGIYLFQVPSKEAVFASLSALVHPEQGERLVANFRDVSALRNITLNNYYNIRMSNVVRTIPRRNAEPLVVSDLAQLLKAVGSVPENGSPAAYARALLAAADRKFVAESILTATCNPTRGTYRHDPTSGRSIETQIKGCGQRFRLEGYAPKDGSRPLFSIPREADGKFSLRFTCPCGAEIRAWGSLQGIKPA